MFAPLYQSKMGAQKTMQEAEVQKVEAEKNQMLDNFSATGQD